jgi:hypothetical protein
MSQDVFKVFITFDQSQFAIKKSKQQVLALFFGKFSGKT